MNEGQRDVNVGAGGKGVKSQGNITLVLRLFARGALHGQLAPFPAGRPFSIDLLQ